jgi:hypothetical protein
MHNTETRKGKQKKWMYKNPQQLEYNMMLGKKENIWYDDGIRRHPIHPLPERRKGDAIFMNGNV